jgi:hypothetical protein
MVPGFDVGALYLLVSVKILRLAATNELQRVCVFALDPQDLLIDILDGAREGRQRLIANGAWLGLSHPGVVLRQANRRRREDRERQESYASSIIHHDLLF